MNMFKRKKLEAVLPATPCSLKMRDSIVRIAKKENVPIAEVQRTAFALFLQKFDSNAIGNDNLTNKGADFEEA